MAERGQPVVPLIRSRGRDVGGSTEVTLYDLIVATIGPGINGEVLTTSGPGGTIFWGPGGTSYLAPAFTSFGSAGLSSPAEVGATITGTQTFTWSTSNSSNVAPNTIAIEDLTTSTVLGSGMPNNGAAALNVGTITYSVPATETWRIFGTDTNGSQFTDDLAVNWYWRVYAGTNSAVTITANQIKALSDSNALQPGFAGTYPITSGSPTYYYFAFPDSMGSPSSFFDPVNNFPISMADVTSPNGNAAYSNTANGYNYALVNVTNANGVTTQYRVYRTQFNFSGLLTMRVS